MTFTEFIQANKDANKHYFDADTMRFFRSKLVRDSWNGDGLFITSEQFVGSQGAAPRAWSIRRGNLKTFDVDSVGEFQQYKTLHRARTALAELRAVEMAVA